MRLDRFNFEHIWFVDAEYNDTSVVCLCALDLKTGSKVELWTNNAVVTPPASWDLKKDLFISYHFPAEAGAFLRLGWEIPRNVVDIMVEFRLHTNKKLPKNAYKQKQPQQRIAYLDCCAYFNIPSIGSEEKDRMRDLILGQTEFSEEEQKQILAYCWTDINPELPRKFFFDNPAEPLLRGVYVGLVTKMEQNGIPLDRDCVEFFHNHRKEICDRLIANRDTHKVFVDNKFNANRFEAVLKELEMFEDWPKTPRSNRCMTCKEVFDVQTSPVIKEIRSLILRKQAFSNSIIKIDENDRTYYHTQTFKTDTGRNAPVGMDLPVGLTSKGKKLKVRKRARFIYSLPKMFRSFIRCPTGKILAYLDYSGQEFGVAAALSQDPMLVEDYLSGDPYINIGKRLGYVTANATKQSHPIERDRLKVINFVMSYGGGVSKLSDGLLIDRRKADAYMLKLLKIYHRYFSWQQECVYNTYATKEMKIRGGWKIGITSGVGATQVKNWPIQATGAEILRYAIINCMVAGIKVLAPIHDAILIEADTEQEILDTQEIMEEVAEGMLGLRIRVGIEKTTDRFIDDPDGWHDFLIMKCNQEVIDAVECNTYVKGKNLVDLTLENKK